MNRTYWNAIRLAFGKQHNAFFHFKSQFNMFYAADCL